MSTKQEYIAEADRLLVQAGVPTYSEALKALNCFAHFKVHQAPRGVSATVWADYLREANAVLAKVGEA